MMTGRLTASAPSSTSSRDRHRLLRATGGALLVLGLLGVSASYVLTSVVVPPGRPTSPPSGAAAAAPDLSLISMSEVFQLGGIVLILAAVIVILASERRARR